MHELADQDGQIALGLSPGCPCTDLPTAPCSVREIEGTDAGSAIATRWRGGRLRDECLNETLFTSLAHARAVLAEWRHDYNTIRPHSGIGNVPPATYTNAGVHGMQRDGTLRSLAGFAPRPVAPPSLVGSDSNETLLIPG